MIRIGGGHEWSGNGRVPASGKAEHEEEKHHSMEEELWLLLLGLGAGGVAAATSRRVMKGLATGYVRVTEAVGSVIGPVREHWREAVDEARKEREQQAAGAGQSRRRVRTRQRQGEQALKQSAGAAGEVGVQVAAAGTEG